MWGRIISTHALTEGDICRRWIPPDYVHFNSRPHGGRQSVLHCFRKNRCISTHALTEGDFSEVFVCSDSLNFNSRPHGGRLLISVSIIPITRIFQLTPSRRATLRNEPEGMSPEISTHALTEGDRWCPSSLVRNNISTHALTEGDAHYCALRQALFYFNSRPHGGRPRMLPRC